MDLFKNSRELLSKTSKPQQNHRQVCRTREESILLEKPGIGKAVINKKPTGVNWGVQNIVASHWLGCNGLSLAGILLGEKESPSSSSWDSNTVSAEVHPFLLDLQLATSGSVRALPASLSAPFKMKF